MKYYAVRKGLRTGIFESWDECKEFVSGYGGAEFKSFKSKEAAEAYMRCEDVTSSGIDLDSILKDESYCVIFSDGSYRDNKVAYGISLYYKKDGVIHTQQLSGRVRLQTFELRNVAGEILGATMAIQTARVQGFKNIICFVDYDGIINWVNGTWSAKGYIQGRFVDFVRRTTARDGLNIEFRWIKGHSGVEGNTRADLLAKKALNYANSMTAEEVYAETYAELAAGKMKETEY